MKNHFCNECSAEIRDGAICDQCDPENGSPQVIATFVMRLPSGKLEQVSGFSFEEKLAQAHLASDTIWKE